MAESRDYRWIDGQRFASVAWNDPNVLLEHKGSLRDAGVQAEMFEEEDGPWALYVPAHEETKAIWLIKRWEREELDNMEKDGHDLTGYGPGTGIRRENR